MVTSASTAKMLALVAIHMLCKGTAEPEYRMSCGASPRTVVIGPSKALITSAAVIADASRASLYPPI
jgi:hypothetical protein